MTIKYNLTLIALSLLLAPKLFAMGDKLIEPGKRTNLANFSTDECSSYPESNPFLENPDANWGHCCVVHDMWYWLGGSLDLKNQADKELNKCVTKETNSVRGNAVELGVKVGGNAVSIWPWRWGYGWGIRGVANKISNTPLELAQYEIIDVKLDSVMNTLENHPRMFRKDQMKYIRKGYDEFSKYIQLKYTE